MRRLKLVTILGTRPEIIRLSKLIPLLDQVAEHYLVHTGQNFSPKLSDVFFSELNLRTPDFVFKSSGNSLGSQIGGLLEQTEVLLKELVPDAVIILGDTNSSLSAIIAERLGFTVFHLEAGNRSFDKEVPEEINRKIVDHISSFNLCYTEVARGNLIAEGLHPNSLTVTGSPLAEVIAGLGDQLDQSKALETLNLTSGGYFLVSAHRQETVDNPLRLKTLLDSLQQLRDEFQLRVIVSTHPRTQSKLLQLADLPSDVEFLEPFGFIDYLKLQAEARFVFSDSGSLSEESSILGFAAATIRHSFERQESLAVGLLPTVGLKFKSWTSAMALHEITGHSRRVPGYESTDFSKVVSNYVFSKLLPRLS